MITRYVKDWTGNMVACFILDDENHFGWSICNWKKGDVFNKKIARKLAIEKAKDESTCLKMPRQYQALARLFLQDPRNSCLKINTFNIHKEYKTPYQLMENITACCSIHGYIEYLENQR